VTVAVWVATGAALACAPASDRSASTAERPVRDARVVDPPPRPDGLRALPLPDFSTMAESVQKQMLGQVSALRRVVERPEASSADLSAEYGRMGTLLMAAEQLDAAEPAYLNAQQLQPDDARWPYYLGQLYRLRGPITQAAASFERVLALRPDDVPALVWLGEVSLTQGRIDAASERFNRVLTLQPQLVPALFGAGRVALERKDYAAAVRLLEQCLKLDSRATATHYPLGMAYRGLGNAALAQVHLAQQGDVKIEPVDPLMAELDYVLESPRAYDIRGGRALETGDWTGAAEQFRKGLDIEPSNPALRLRLGSALAQMGDVEGAREQFERVLQESPNYARAHYSLGILAEEQGRRAEAIERLTAAVEHAPDDPSSRLMLAGLLRRSGQPALALRHYERARTLAPARVEITLGYVLTLARLERYQDARNVLLEATKAFPDEPEYAHALARLLATAPDARVRDGRRALTIAEGLLKGRASTQLGETLAMALAELGRFEQAVSVQRDVMAVIERGGLPDQGGVMAANLELYENRKPSRTPWPPD
jgi:tetratricopeptide (TPR) repeat protein